jgi:hypothetical protein
MVTAPLLRLPKWLEADPRAPALLRGLQDHMEPLAASGVLRIPAAACSPEVIAALQQARDAGQLSRGLEGAERRLMAEARGLALADAKAASSRGVRLSRLLVLANDGAPRFFRNVETLIERCGARALALRLDVDAARLGAPLFGAGSQARLVMLDHKVAVGMLLLALAPQWGIDAPAGSPSVPQTEQA